MPRTSTESKLGLQVMDAELNMLKTSRYGDEVPRQYPSEYNDRDEMSRDILNHYRYKDLIKLNASTYRIVL
jgi:hypothetical protein